MKTELKLVKNKGFKWFEDNGIHIKGYLYIDGVYSSHENVVKILKDATSEVDLVKAIEKLNGCFSIILDTDYGLFAFSDTTRSFPLMYCKTDKGIYISDSSEEIVRWSGKTEFNHNGVLDYLHSGSVFYNETLVKDIYQVCAMHYLKIAEAESNPTYTRYKEVYSNEFEVFDPEVAYNKLNRKFEEVSKRLVDSLNGRTAVVYLSGGVDSRACLMLLKMADYKDVICVSYGKKGWDEIEVATQVAKEMGYTQIVINHDRKKWKKTYKEAESLDFIEYSNNLDAITHMESHYVTRQLHDENLIPKDSVILTGHIGVAFVCKFDMKKTYSSRKLVETFWKYAMKLYPYSGRRKKQYLNRLSGYFGKDKIYSGKEAEKLFENAAYNTIRAKHIVNYHRQFEYYGYEWRMPLLDKKIMEFAELCGPPSRDIKKSVFSKLVIDFTTPNVRANKEPSSFLQKVSRNLFNPVYAIIRPWKFLTAGYKKGLLPAIPIRQYRFYRRFYSYCALVEIKIVQKMLARWSKKLPG